MARPWKSIVSACVALVADDDGYFSIDQLREHFDEMRAEKPQNAFIAEKVRQQLQILRDEGKVAFLIPGSYRVVDMAWKIGHSVNP
jgi:hypothetical protein